MTVQIPNCIHDLKELSKLGCSFHATDNTSNIKHTIVGMYDSRHGLLSTDKSL